ncbi:MAG: hypothetical protein ACT4QG_00785 [Sporichthyaceae bacterium]
MVARIAARLAATTVARLVDLDAVTQTVDALGKAIGSPSTVALRTSAAGENVGEYSCLPKTKGNRDFHQFKPTQIFRGDDKGKVQGLFHIYRQDGARTVGRGFGSYESVQFEVCGVGGSDPDGRTRTRRAGIGITFADAANTYKIAQAWKEGETPSNFTMDMAFKVAHKGVEIGGGISQTPTNKLLGSIATPFAADVDVYARNAVNAWWQDGCVNSWKGCQFFNGSKDFHGAVAHGLFEFTPGQAGAAARQGFLVSTFRSTN